MRNVIADLPGTGYFHLPPGLLKKLKEYLLKQPWPGPPPGPVAKLLYALLGDPRGRQKWRGAEVWKSIRDAKRLLDLWPWYPWWRRCFYWYGFGAQIVIVGCHLDSTASRVPAYHPATDSAPGRDDDASGMAATLAIARQFWGLRGHLHHTVRFCFFNAEEQGLVGSGAYAALLRSSDAPVKAVVCAT